MTLPESLPKSGISVSVLGDFLDRFFRRYLEEPAYAMWAQAHLRLAGACRPSTPHKGNQKPQHEHSSRNPSLS